MCSAAHERGPFKAEDLAGNWPIGMHKSTDESQSLTSLASELFVEIR